MSLAIQFGGESFHPGHINLLQPLVLLALAMAFGGLALPLLGLLVPRARGRLRSRRARRRRLHAAATAEARTRALMSELCPHGWQAQITVLETDEDLGAGVQPPPARVVLDWAELARGSGRAVVMRRVSAPTIAEALERMVADRRTDETLEQIEHGAVSDGVWWPDL